MSNSKEPRELPVLLNTSMVVATLEDRKTKTKTKTRRPMKIQPPSDDYIMSTRISTTGNKSEEGRHHWVKMSDDNLNIVADQGIFFLSQYKVGDLLYVRESAKVQEFTYNSIACHALVSYKASDAWSKWFRWPDRIKPVAIGRSLSNGCFKEAARIWLRVTGVKAERLQDITEEDAIKEGIVKVSKDGIVNKYCLFDKGDYSSTPWQEMARTAKEAYKRLWNSLYGSWDDNPWVWEYTYEVVSKTGKDGIY